MYFLLLNLPHVYISIVKEADRGIEISSERRVKIVKLLDFVGLESVQLFDL